ncbi:putative B3 domain-containing protein [Glycine max]|nr:putative B3 domain-containing protein [Glycine max]
MFHCSSITITMGDFSLHENNMDYHQDNPAVFFTIINNTKLLKVPEEFLKHLNEDLSSNAVLIGPSGDKWQVTILKKGNNVYMNNGWSQFLKDNSVVLDEFLLFTYHGGNCFYVQIFCGNGLERLCLKETRQEQAVTPQFLDLTFSNKALISDGCEIKKTSQEQASTPSLVRITNKSKQRKTSAGSFLHHESKSSCQEDLPFSNKALLSKDFPKPLSSIKFETSEACKLAESFTSRNPHWKHLMTKCNVEDHCTLHIATQFACKYIPEVVKQIILWNSEGKFWEVEVTCLRYQNKRYTRFTTGWGKFVRDNKLMKGDTCIFELEDENHMSVHIFRTRNNRERWKMDYHQDNPAVFFTTIKNTKQLKVPEEFLKHLNKDLWSNSVLIGPSGDKWQVTILKKGNNVYMDNGWSQFLKDNSVVLDEFLLFTYHGGNCFYVQIFGGNGLERLCRKEAREEQAATPQFFDLPFSNKASISDGCEIKKTRQEQASAPSLARTNKSKQRKTFVGSSHLHESNSYKKDLPFSNKASLSKDFPKPQSSINIECSEACKLAESFTSRNPHWKHLLTKCNLERCILLIAAEFARKYIPEALEQIYLWNSEGKSWEVRVHYFRNRNTWYAAFKRGWERFVRDNKLMKGDTCIFEVEEEQGHWSVHIFRTGCAPH